MNPKVAVVASVVILVAGSWLWIARDTSHDVSEAEDATGVGEERHEQRADSKGELSSRKPFSPPPSPSRARTDPESEALESGVARSGSPSRGNGVALERREPARRARAVDDGHQSGAVDDSESAHGSEEFGRFKQKLGALRDIARETPGGDPIEPDAADLSPEDVDRLDVDGDEAILPWELERSQWLVERAERHPVKNDVYDGAYPVERGDYARSGWEFDAIDTNRDDLMDVDEYYSFLFEAERTSVLLDTNGDGHISPDESGLSEADFAPLDRDGSGFLMPWEMRQGVALEAFDVN